MRVLKEKMNTPFFHIMCQGINKEYIFSSEQDKIKYMKIMEKTKEEIKIIILAYCIMNNHVHILFHEKDTKQITKYMQKVNLLYAKYYNKKYERVGYVFRDRFKTQPIYTERYLCTCVRYIYNNPVKANICNHAKEYKYSSYSQNKFYTDTPIERKIRKFICGEEVQEEYNEFVLLEDEQNKKQIHEEIFEELLQQKNITLKDLKNNKELLAKLVKKLKNDYKISFRSMERMIGIGRETLRKMI